MNVNVNVNDYCYYYHYWIVYWQLIVLRPGIVYLSKDFDYVRIKIEHKAPESMQGLLFVSGFPFVKGET